MRTRTYRTALLSTLLLAGCTPRETMPELTDRVFAVAAAQYEQLEGRLTDETLPRSVASDGKFIPSNIRWWCSGFYPGSLWYIYEYTGDKTFRELAEKNTFKLYPLKQKGTDHDLGFQMNCVSATPTGSPASRNTSNPSTPRRGSSPEGSRP